MNIRKIRWPALFFWAGQFFLGLVVIGFVVLLVWHNLAPVRIADQFFQDVLVRFYIANKTSSDIQYTAVVDIDDESLQILGQWPWPRYRTATLLNILAKRNPDDLYMPPATIALDFLFSEQDRSSLTRIKEVFKEEFGLDISFIGVPSGLEDNDGYLGSIFASSKAVGSYFMYFDVQVEEETCIIPPLQVTGEVTAITPPQAYGMLCNTPRVQNGIRYGGYANALLDSDGVLRSLPLLINYKDGWYPSLALAAIMQAQRVHGIHIKTDFFGPVIIAGQTRIPVDETGRALVPFLGPQGTIPTFSATQIFSGDIDLAQLSERIVFLGSSAIGLHDLYHTPVDLEFPGVEVHATFAENVISGKGLREPVWRQKYITIATLFAGLATAIFFIFLRPERAIVAVFIVMSIPFAISLWFFLTRGILLPVAGPVLIIFFLSLLFSLQLYIRERRKALYRLKQLLRSRKTLLDAISAVVKSSDSEKEEHIKRTQEYIRILAESLAQRGNYPELTPKYIEMLYYCAPLHDIGKIGISDAILDKTGPLTDGEFSIVKEHALLGKNIMENASKEADDKDFFQMVGELAYTHHERWDGKGYPQGLSGESIPLSGRLMALVDVYDALVHSQHYKKAVTHEEAKAIILEGRGTQFDPFITDAFFAVEQEFFRISKEITGK